MTRAIHWFRSDLRIEDNEGLRAGCERADELVPVFVLDDALLEGRWKSPARKAFLFSCLEALDRDLRARGSRLIVRRGDPADVLPRLAEETKAKLVTWNRDYSRLATSRDARVEASLRNRGAEAHSFKDRVVFEADEVATQSGSPFRVYSPFRKAWWKRYGRESPEPRRVPRIPRTPSGIASDEIPKAKSDVELPPPGSKAARRRLDRFLDRAVARYGKDRDFPAVDGTSRLSAYLRFGVISVRTCVGRALEVAREDRRSREGARKWIDELVWREFYHSVLAANPSLFRKPFRAEFASIEWNDDDSAFDAWCRGETGYPIVDAGMRELAATGWMHNRARMIVASFLAKDLLVDWRRGESHFMERLLDGDPASNDGGWQWAASTGTDPQPWFRIFNPVLQGKRYDPDGDYVRRWIPDLESVPIPHVHEPWKARPAPSGYPDPIVDHAERRILALQRYESARAQT